MEKLRHSLLKTLVYFDMFDFAPTLLELEKWLLADNLPKFKITELQKALIALPQVSQKQGFYFFTDREKLVRLRKKKYDQANLKIKRARFFLKLLACLPQVKAIFLVNSVAWGNAQKNSDTDLAIITTAGRIWTARFFTTALMRILRQRPYEQTPDKALCLSLYLTENKLNLEKYKIGLSDIHFAFWATQFYPIYDPQDLYLRYQKENSWLKQIFHNLSWNQIPDNQKIKPDPIFKDIKRILNLLNLEKILEKLQKKIMPTRLKQLANTDNRVVLNDYILKFHDNDHRQELQQEWAKRIKMYV
ncbi:MAG: hypothetical protein A2233_01655 [Candidatus Kerfeldbacteria bacterium RIFOXYA2_FULL_38_24]|uniref:Polymerase nucleotidyl transferase domain-containing protein n=1 Tax=Candidatus Kerfeldbacteria bacterium RIFOXYB2_FULL_38_14 TaxID=1798547 RepID=A0A1G2BG08_9BACT|nr:MAG: hypothetical protein A2319_04265 [Candidatus Kerfeldbacteria bacterium RIFOXYB2_FULL_38_14]OGY87824.1 MAG: hypothetical protein A2233_01655 [Candidatus Kerfeldbacteria bacterium RIFOXYA2_FULL_38_24]OGY90546.1 MAG: hypothetical protein A2458_02160 [Candidatus Kerfeldbacteria bacterium RIFOXYC2_FULL_38_9]